MNKKYIRLFMLVLAIAVTAVAALSCSQELSAKLTRVTVELCISAEKPAPVSTQTEAVRIESKLDAAVKTVANLLCDCSACNEKQQDINIGIKPVAFAPLIYFNDEDAVPG